MGFADRAYYRDAPRRFSPWSGVAILLFANIAIWLIQFATIRTPLPKILQEFLACNPEAVFEKGWIWQIFTANFLHAPGFGHILGNMLFLFFFGRELEEIYGRRNFLIFYILAGCTAIFAEAAIAHFFYGGSPRILGASGAVMGTVVLFTLFFPRREIYLGFLIPVQVWILCIIYVLLDLSGALSRDTGVAHWAHLFGAGVGVLYRFVDLRWETVSARLSVSSRRLRIRLGLAKGPRLVREPRRSRSERAEERDGRRPSRSPEPDPISERIDKLLAKIHESGRESLTSEELEFLQKNSGRYRSRG